MWDVRVCAACLATDVRMYSMINTSLLELYRLLTGIENEMPQKLCWECAALVLKFNMFRHKCERASLLLQDIYMKHDEVSEQEVLKVNRENYNLISTYSVSSIQVHNIELNSKRYQGHKMFEAENINNSQTDNVSMELPSIKLEIELIKKEEVPIEPKTESNDTELTDDIFVEEYCSEAVQLELPQKIKCDTKRRNSKPRGKREIKGITLEILSQEQQMEVMREKQNAKVYKSARYPCTLCYMSFTQEKAFNNHMLKHDPVSGEFICDLCKLRFKIRLKLVRHIHASHMKRYSCKLCSSAFYNRRTAIAHNAWHEGVVYTCRICSATFSKKRTLHNHLHLKHSSEHVCGQCGDSFHSKRGLLQHKSMSHKLKSDTVVSGGEQEASGPYCAECDIQFTCKQAWTRHILISPKHQHERHICALGCETCGETLPDKKSLRAHCIAHRRAREELTKPNICTQSKKCIEQRTCKHTSERPFMCDICSKRFTARETLLVHIRSHTKELPYKCNICERAFSSQSNFQRHKKVHTDAKPYACDICGKCFKYQETVKSHFEYVHMKKPWPKRDRSKRQSGNELQSTDDKPDLSEHERPG